MRCRAAAIAEADRGIGRMIRLLRAQGELDDTAFVFYSDNGFFDGQHRIVKSKGLPYEESIQVPAMIRVPDAYLDGPRSDADRSADLQHRRRTDRPRPRRCASPASSPGDCRRIDGRSMLDALNGDPSWSPERPILIEVDQFGDVAGGTLACTWAGVRVGEQVYVEYERVVRRGPATVRADERGRALPPRRRSGPEAQPLAAATSPPTPTPRPISRRRWSELRDCEGNDDLQPGASARGPRPPCE